MSRSLSLLVSIILVASVSLSMLQPVASQTYAGEFIVLNSNLSIGRNTIAVYGEIQNVGHRTHYVPSVSVTFYLNNNYYSSGSTYCDAGMLRPLETCQFSVQLTVGAPPTGHVTYAVNIGSVLQV